MSHTSGADNKQGVFPGSIAGLKVEALAEAREYTALAALAHTANDVRALASASGESEAAFRWMWTIATAGPQQQRWEQVRRDLGEGIGPVTGYPVTGLIRTVGARASTQLQKTLHLIADTTTT